MKTLQEMKSENTIELTEIQTAVRTLYHKGRQNGWPVVWVLRPDDGTPGKLESGGEIELSWEKVKKAELEHEEVRRVGFRHEYLNREQALADTFCELQNESCVAACRLVSFPLRPNSEAAEFVKPIPPAIIEEWHEAGGDIDREEVLAEKLSEITGERTRYSHWKLDDGDETYYDKAAYEAAYTVFKAQCNSVRAELGAIFAVVSVRITAADILSNSKYTESYRWYRGSDEYVLLNSSREVIGEVEALHVDDGYPIGMATLMFSDELFGVRRPEGVRMDIREGNSHFGADRAKQAAWTISFSADLTDGYRRDVEVTLNWRTVEDGKTGDGYTITMEPDSEITTASFRGDAENVLSYMALLQGAMKLVKRWQLQENVTVAHTYERNAK